MMKKTLTVANLCLAVILLTLSASAQLVNAETEAIQLKSVSAVVLPDGVRIDILADDAVDVYNAFTLEDPARIVFDFPKMKSPFQSTQAIPLNSRWASRVRHFGHPDKVRLVVDTESEHLSSFSAHPFSGGLKICVGSCTQTEVRESEGIPARASGRAELKSISLGLEDDALRALIRVEGKLLDYKSFSLDDPPRIVFDLFGLSIADGGLQIVPVNSAYVSAIRYHGYPDKVRLVLDTTSSYLSSYTTETKPDGLEIVVGKTEELRGQELVKAVDTTASADALKTPLPPVKEEAASEPITHKPVQEEAESKRATYAEAEVVNQKHRLRALKVGKNALSLDGSLNESAWQRAPAATAFLQFQPDEGAPSTESTEARVLYDEKALYIGIRAFEQNPSEINAQLTRRDRRSYSDWVAVAIDSYNDRRTAFQFAVNPKGVKRDSYLHDDTRMDTDWDAVWDVQTAIDNRGWTAEFRIPYSQLRFPHIADQTWGIQFSREIARREEISNWAPLSMREYAVVSKFGRLTGLNGIEPPSRLEVMPYVMTKLQRAPGDDANPMYEENDLSAEAGLDLKYGVTGDLTLDVTVNPDFGQVEADPAQVNLTAFETYFPERRPFFIEGASIFDFVLGYGPTGMPDERIFYSRRIGRDATTIQIAEKLSGKTASAWTIGLLHAATADPSTQYSMMRMQKDFKEGYSALGMVATGVFRSSDEADALGIPRRAITGGFDFRHRFWDNRYQISGFFIGSQVSGSRETISSRQQASSRYMQRPDADHVEYDPERTSLEGTSASLTFRKVGQGSWRYGAVVRSRSPEFDVSDMGFARRSDIVFASTYLMYFHNTPTRYLRRWSLNWSTWYQQTHGNEPNRIGTDFYSRIELPNYWTIRGGLNYDFSALSTDMLRGGPAFEADDQINAFTRISTDSRKKMQVNLSASYSTQWESDSWSFRLSPSIDWRPSSRVQVSTGVSYRRNERNSQWVDRWWKKWSEVTEDTPYVLGHMSQETISMTGRVDVAFTPNLSFQLYLQPFISAGKFDDFRQVIDPRAAAYENRFASLKPEIDADCYGSYLAGVEGSENELCLSMPDFNYKQFRSNAVLRWEYRPGSTLFVVWSQARQHSGELGDLDFGSDFGTLFDSPSDDVFLVKIRHWF